MHLSVSIAAPNHNRVFLQARMDMWGTELRVEDSAWYISSRFGISRSFVFDFFHVFWMTVGRRMYAESS